MSWLDRLMDRITRRGTKVVGSGHPPDDTQQPGTPPTNQDPAGDEPHLRPPPPPTSG
jgi:hypothetical protein